MGLKARREFAAFPGVGEKVLNRLEAVFRRRFKTVEKIELGIKHGQVGSELGHGVLPVCAKALAQLVNLEFGEGLGFGICQ